MPRACIAKETIDIVKSRYLEKYGKALNTKQALFFAGFDPNRKVIVRTMTHRVQYLPRFVYKGDVYIGYTRNCVQKVDLSGEIIYSREPHPLTKLYQSVEVVTGNYVTDDMIEITEFGNPTSED